MLRLMLAAALAAPTPRQVHESAIVIDTHADTPMRLVDEGFDLAADAGAGHLDIAKARAGNLGAEFFSIWVDPRRFAGGYAHRALAMIDAVHEQLGRHPDALVLALTADDIVAARRGPAPRLAVLIGVEGGHAIENDLRLLRVFHRLGARYMTLTWANSNEWADASGDVEDAAITHHGGLSPFGEQVVAELNRLGMMVDLSHVADETFFDTLRITRAPVIASHSGARAVCDHPRNLSDDMLAAVAKNGGVVQVNFFSGFLDRAWNEAWKAGAPARAAEVAALDERLAGADASAIAAARSKLWHDQAARMPRPPLDRLLEHIDHVVKVAGIDHVGLGSDFDGIPSLPAGIDSAADLPKITSGLLARGYTPEQVTKVLGGNLLRVMRAAERAAATRTTAAR